MFAIIPSTLPDAPASWGDLLDKAIYLFLIISALVASVLNRRKINRVADNTGTVAAALNVTQHVQNDPRTPGPNVLAPFIESTRRIAVDPASAAPKPVDPVLLPPATCLPESFKPSAVEQINAAVTAKGPGDV
jgi:hypothetical protein